jgi:hypothetical protein
MADAEAAGEVAAAPEQGAAANLGSMHRVLLWIGFDLQATRDALLEELGDDLIVFQQIKPKDIDSLVKTLMGRTPAARRVPTGFQQQQKLKAVIHWAKDRHRIGLDVEIHVGDNVVEAHYQFLRELSASSSRAAIREADADSRSTRAKDASPGKLKDEKNWDEWEQSLYTMLNILHGVNGVPLCYVIREEEHKEGDIYPAFVDQCTARAKLEGPEFEADTRTVHQILQSLTVGENAAIWLKDLAKKNDGRKDMAALRSHYRGAGNQSRRINQAKRLHETLHYKNERAMKFSDFISKAKQMFNIYEDCKETQPESAKLRFLWQKVDNQELQPAIEAMRAQLGQNASAWTFVTACDHLASQIPADGTTRAKFTTSALDRGGGNGDATSKIMRDGKIHTGQYTKTEWWDVLSQEDRDRVMAERKKTRSQHTGKKNAKSKPKGQDRKVKALEKKVKHFERKLSSLQRSTGATEDSSASSDSSVDGDNAGNAFGGRAAKKSAKKKRKKN